MIACLTGSIGLPRACCQAVGNDAFSNTLQLSDIQSGRWLTRSCLSAGWIGSGTLDLPGTSWNITCRLLREIASATVLLAPGMCSACTEMLYNAQKKCIHLSKCMISESLLVCEAMMLTTAMLSHHTSTWRCCHCAPQMAHAKAIGSSSLAAMPCWSQLPFHSICIHLSFHTAPQPHDPDASELNVISGCPPRVVNFQHAATVPQW